MIGIQMGDENPAPPPKKKKKKPTKAEEKFQAWADAAPKDVAFMVFKPDGKLMLFLPKLKVYPNEQAQNVILAAGITSGKFPKEEKKILDDSYKAITKSRKKKK